jgi:hypothetical protein
MASRSIERFLFSTGNMYIINLPYRNDRRREISDQLAKIDLSFDHPQVSLFPAFRPDEPAGFPTIGARGCFLSHLGVLRATAAANQDRVLICEDDLDFAPDLISKLDRLTNELDRKEWSIFYGGYEGTLPAQRGLDEIETLDPSTPLICAHFYAVREPALSKLIDYLEAIISREAGDAAGGPMHYDGALSRFRADFPEFTTLAASSPLGYQRSSRTDIHATKWFDRIPVVREGIAALRQVRNRIRRL